MTERIKSTLRNNGALVRAVISAAVALITIAACIIPMGKLPIWNGEIPAHRNQYELMAEAILDGRISFDYNDDEGLSRLENPYDPEARREAGVKYHWDHAYYDGNYYMYFGIVPVFLLFLPCRVLTGTALTTFHATQIFAAVSILGIFMLFSLLRKLFLKRMPFGVYLCLCAAFSVMSVWYSAAEPALYCTAITAAIALEVWSLYFFVRAVYGEQRENIQLIFAAVGALLGALVFGCRPPIALANIIVIPLLVVFIRQRKFSVRLLGKLMLAALPYLAVGAALMLYNYVRFDSPFEFGQAYQLTVADQSNYSVRLDGDTLVRLVNESAKNFFFIRDITTDFPYLQASSVFANFPILLMGVAIFEPRVFTLAKEKRLLSFIGGVCAAVLVIVGMDILWSPYLLERYRMDIYFLMGIACFAVIGLSFERAGERARKVLSAVTVCMCVFTVISAFLLFSRTVGNYYPDVMKNINQMW